MPANQAAGDEATGVSLMVSIAILTKNEAADLPACMEALGGYDDVHVVDSGSTDATMKIAESAGASRYSHIFGSFGKQRNWALDNCSFKYPWVLFIDADEVITPEFRGALSRAIDAATEDVAGFYCCWKLMLYGRWLKRCDGFPKWQFRVVRRGRANFTDFGHGQKEGEVDGRIDYIREPYLHYAFSKGWSPWLDRHNRYSTLEAKDRLAADVSWPDVFTRNGSQRNKALKPLLSRVPGWPLLRFLADYIGRLGFLEGKAGLAYCLNMAIYEYFIQLKMAELRVQGRC